MKHTACLALSILIFSGCASSPPKEAQSEPAEPPLDECWALFRETIDLCSAEFNDDPVSLKACFDVANLGMRECVSRRRAPDPLPTRQTCEATLFDELHQCNRWFPDLGESDALFVQMKRSACSQAARDRYENCLQLVPRAHAPTPDDVALALRLVAAGLAPGSLPADLAAALRQ